MMRADLTVVAQSRVAQLMWWAPRVCLGRLPAVIAALSLVGVYGLVGCSAVGTSNRPASSASSGGLASAGGSASSALAALSVKGRAAKTGYARSDFGVAWTDATGDLWGDNGLNTRDDVLSRDFQSMTCKTQPTSRSAPHCIVQDGVLHDPYTGTTIHFARGETTSQVVQIDHVVALGDSWQTGAQQLTPTERADFANDPLNLVAVDGPTNTEKSDSDAASWLPPNKAFRCAYVARQIAVKVKYRLWVTSAEQTAMRRVLSACPSQRLPTTVEIGQRTY